MQSVFFQVHLYWFTRSTRGTHSVTCPDATNGSSVDSIAINSNPLSTTPYVIPTKINRKYLYVEYNSTVNLLTID